MRWTRGIGSFIVALVILVGGYQLYQIFYIEKAVENAFKQIPGAKVLQTEMAEGGLYVKVSVPPRFIEEFPTIYNQMLSQWREQKIMIEFSSNTNPTLVKAWDEMNFGIREGISLKRYTKVQETVRQYTSKHGVESRLTMDQGWILVQLRKDSHYIHRLILLDEDSKQIKQEGDYNQT